MNRNSLLCVDYEELFEEVIMGRVIIKNGNLFTIQTSPIPITFVGFIRKQRLSLTIVEMHL